MNIKVSTLQNVLNNKTGEVVLEDIPFTYEFEPAVPNTSGTYLADHDLSLQLAQINMASQINKSLKSGKNGTYEPLRDIHWVLQGRVIKSELTT